ncbi:hypothetical protein H9P43_004119 [Blastocladiella emersonii ATCC 22665]|nr:hypothetical protein H9P43_004119 [Blastocladiella emersonii ATCC 22665]
MSYRPVPTSEEPDMDISDMSSINEDVSTPTLLSPDSVAKLNEPGIGKEPATTGKAGSGGPGGPGLTVSTQRPDSPPQVVEIGTTPRTDDDVGPSRAFIRIVGVPSGTADPAAVDTIVVHSANITSPRQALPELSPTSAGKHLVDVIDAENEDPFTIESFESLMALCAERGKDFILARVVTVDPHDETKFYHSFYAAHHINKVLFRTQPEEGLLHRMKAKNPLNNMTIVGDVHYYAVTPDAYFEARRAAGLAEGKGSGGGGKSARASPVSPTSSVKSSRAAMLFGKPPAKTLAEHIRDALFPPPAATSPTGEGSSSSGGDRRKLRLVLTDPTTVLESNGGAAAGGTSMKRRPSADDIYQFIAKSSPTAPNAPELDLGRVDIAQPAVLHPVSASSSSPNPRGRTTNRGTPRLTRSMSTSAAHKKKAAAAGSPTAADRRHWDWLDQFYSKSRGGGAGGVGGGVEKPYFKIRSVSYRNERALNADSTPLTVEDWVSLHCGEQVTQLLTTKRNAAAAAVVPGGAAVVEVASGVSPTASGPASARLRAGTKPVAGTVAGANSPAPKRQVVQYEAKYFGTDDDFLMKSSVRNYFKAQAVEADDAVLFTIPSTTTVVLPQDGGGAGDNLEPHPALAGFHYTIEGLDEADDGTWRGRVRRAFRNGNNVLKITLVAYVVAGSLLVKFVVPENLVYLVTFLLVFVLCFFLVFFVECEI